MSFSRTAVGRRRAARVVIALAVVSACLGAVVAYAATRPGGKHHGHGEGRASNHRERLLQPQLIEMPPPSTEEIAPQFRFNVPPRVQPDEGPEAPGPEAEPPAEPETSTRRFQCRLDGAEWERCRSPYQPAALDPGSHRFAVRVFNRENRVGEAAGYSWQQTAPRQPQAQQPPAAPPNPPPPAEDPPAPPKQFTIEALEEPSGLMPGLPARPIPVRVTNPNSVPIEVTSLSVAIGAAPDACPAENFALTPAGVSAAEPLTVPAESSVDLPAGEITAPAIQMLNLPVNQDSCQELQIPLIFGGEAHG